MCTGVEVAMLASAAVGTYSAIRSGEQQEDYAKYQADQAEADASAERSAAQVHAEKIRKMYRAQMAESKAQLAGSGVDVGAGTALEINKEIVRSGEEDAMTMILSGKDRSNRLNAEAQGARLRGSQARTAGYLNAASSALGGYAAYGSAKGWKTNNATTAPAGGRG